MSLSGESPRISVSLTLAVLWHDPPWKPWGIAAEVGVRKTAISGGEGEYHERIARALEQLLKSGAKELPSREAGGRIAEKLRYMFDELKKIAKGRSARKHEIQALLMPALLWALLDDDMHDIAETIKKAGESMARGDEKIRCSDHLASAADRSLLSAVMGEAEKATELAVVNPFEPRGLVGWVSKKPLDTKTEIPASKVAAFIYNYASIIAGILKRAREASPDCGRPCLEKLLRDSAFLLLEPIWYASVGPEYVPSADTRIPTHTVFDHVNAALTALLWCQSGSKTDPRGILAVVDLASVQGWIEESRALKDLWAASWLASLLAWKAVERLVDLYGPGVMVSPPLRLNPLAATRLILSRVSPDGGDFEVRLIATPAEGLGQGDAVVRVSLQKLLGIPHGWPIDPTTPTRLTIALPPYASDDLERVPGEVQAAWRLILGKALRRLRMLQVLLERCGIDPREAGLIVGLLDHAERLEPPLAMRIYKVRVEDAYRDAVGIAGEVIKKTGVRNVKVDDIAGSLYYHIALTLLAAEEVEVKAPGRRLGSAYMEYAKEAYRVSNGSPGACIVCGKAPAIIDGSKLLEEIAECIRGQVEAGGEVEEAKSILGDVGEDRLCPYCLAKRMLRTLLLRDGLAQELLGVKIPAGAAERILFPTIDVYTSRYTLCEPLLEKTVSEIEASTPNLWDVIEKLPPTLRSIAYRAAGGSPREALKLIAVELMHDEALHRRTRADLERLGLKKISRLVEAASRVRSKVAILAVDGDYMGSGVLSGKLLAGVDDYISSSLKAQLEEKLLDTYKRLYKAALESLHNYSLKVLSKGWPHCRRKCDSKEKLRVRPPTLIVTPSYHYSVSRALALQAALDREVIEEAGGALIYAGGDDLLAVLPPAAPGKTGGSGGACTYESYSFPAAEAARRVRLAYWGSHERRAGPFNELRVTAEEEGGGGEVRITVAVAPSLRAYGRSGALYIADISTPLWSILETTRRLEESKDSIVRASLASGSGGAVCLDTDIPLKDVLVVASDSAGASPIPFTLPTGKGLVFVDLLAPAMRLANFTLGPPQRRSLSASFYYDYLDVAPSIRRVAVADPRAAGLLLEYAIARNREVKEVDPRVVREGVFENPVRVSGVNPYTTMTAASARALGGLLEANAYTTPVTCRDSCTGRLVKLEALDLVSAIVSTARVLRGSL